MEWQMCARVDRAKRIGQTRQNEEDVPQKNEPIERKKWKWKNCKIGESNEKSELNIEQYTQMHTYIHSACSENAKLVEQLFMVKR